MGLATRSSCDQPYGTRSSVKAISKSSKSAAASAEAAICSFVGGEECFPIVVLERIELCVVAAMQLRDTGQISVVPVDSVFRWFEIE